MSIQSWVGSELAPKAGIINVSNDWLLEVRDIKKLLKANPIPFVALSPEDMELPHSLNLFKKIGDILHQGLGFCILNRLPVENTGGQLQLFLGLWLRYRYYDLHRHAAVGPVK